MHLLIDQTTEYRFSEPQLRIVQLLRLTPDSLPGQTVISWRIDVDRDARLKAGRDGYGNLTTMLYSAGPLDTIVIRVTGEVLLENRSGVLDPSIETLPPEVFLQTTPLTRRDPLLTTLIAEGGPAADRLIQLNAALHDRLTLDLDPAPVNPDPVGILESGHGRPVDFAHLFVSAARSAQIPARVVTGYCYADVPYASPHCWAEAFVEGIGWMGFDPAFGRCPRDNYIRTAVGLDYRDAAPFSGARTGGGEEDLRTTVQVDLSQSFLQQ